MGPKSELADSFIRQARRCLKVNSSILNGLDSDASSLKTQASHLMRANALTLCLTVLEGTFTQ